MTLHPLVGIFMLVWFGGLTVMEIGTLTGPGAAPVFDSSRLETVGMLLFGWVLVSGGFTIEALAARQRFREIAGVGEGNVSPRRETAA